MKVSEYLKEILNILATNLYDFIVTWNILLK